MNARLIRIGNSRGVRLPKGLIEEAGLLENVELTVRPDGLLISPVRGTRSGWAEAARSMQARGEGGLLDAGMPTHFDDGEWEW